MNGFDCDAAVIGAGVVGCAIARELSRFELRTILIEKEEDVCSGTSKANSAIIHAGFDAVCGTDKAKFNVLGNRMMDRLAEELDFEFRRNGSLVLCFSKEEEPVLEELLRRGRENGVPGLRILTGDEVREMEPHVSPRVWAALYAPTGGIVCPFGMTIALAENACENGVELRRNTCVEMVERIEIPAEPHPETEQQMDGVPQSGWRLTTSRGTITARCVINAAGVYADVFHNMVSAEKMHITARKGEYCLLDKEAGHHVERTIFQVPGKYGKGILVTPTIHGNLLLGPTAADVEDREETAVTAEGLAEVFAKSAAGVDHIPYRQAITSFAGLRAHEKGDDFVIGEVKDAEGFFDAAGIESPGLTSAPAIGVYVAELVAEKASAFPKQNFVPVRKGIPRAASLDWKQRAELLAKRPDYGDIVCRCEQISEGEIVDAIRRPAGAVSLDGLKRRVRQGMGRCQAGFCTPRAMEILARELGITMEEVCKNGAGSRMLTEDDRRADHGSDESED